MTHEAFGETRAGGTESGVIDYDRIAELYDVYVTADDDVPFFVFELYDTRGQLRTKQILPMRFELIERDTFEAMARAAGFRVCALYGDYARRRFDAATSPFMIWVLDSAAGAEQE